MVAVLVMIIPFVIGKIYPLFNDCRYNISDAVYEISVWARILAPDIYHIEYSIGFVLLGISWYFCGRSKTERLDFNQGHPCP